MYIQCQYTNTPASRYWLLVIGHRLASRIVIPAEAGIQSSIIPKLRAPCRSTGPPAGGSDGNPVF